MTSREALICVIGLMIGFGLGFGSGMFVAEDIWIPKYKAKEDALQMMKDREDYDQQSKFFNSRY